MMTETTVEILFDKGCSETLSNSVLEGVLYESMKRVPLPSYTAEELAFAREIKQYLSLPMSDFILPWKHMDILLAGSSDVGDASKIMPTAQFVAATVVPGTPGHSWQMVAQGKSGTAKKGMLYAAQVLADAGKTLLENPELIRKAKAEFREEMNERLYICPIPKEIQPHIHL